MTSAAAATGLAIAEDSPYNTPENSPPPFAAALAEATYQELCGMLWTMRVLDGVVRTRRNPFTGRGLGPATLREVADDIENLRVVYEGTCAEFEATFGGTAAGYLRRRLAHAPPPRPGETRPPKAAARTLRTPTSARPGKRADCQQMKLAFGPKRRRGG